MLQMRQELRAAAGLALAFAAALGTDARAQAYPTRPIHLVVGFAPGGAADYVARGMSDALARALGQPVLVENRAGAGSVIGTEYVAKAAPDGYTILIASPAGTSVGPALNHKLGYKASDLAPVTKVSSSPLVVAVNPSIGINSIAELIAQAKKSPGKFNYATSGVGSAPHLSAIEFAHVAGLDMVHVPFKGGGLAVQAVVAGDVQLTFGTPPSVLPLIKAGRLRGLAVTSRGRSALFPDLPGMEEAGLPGYDMAFWYGVFVPTGTPPEIIRKLFDASVATLRLPQVKEIFAREGTDTAMSRSPEDFAAFLAEDGKLWVRLVKESGAKIE
jgi:tripartite-type tricarboxylate transporter receptor subunit TctC